MRWSLLHNQNEQFALTCKGIDGIKTPLSHAKTACDAWMGPFLATELLYEPKW